ncbi:MAG: hypothetical protein KKC46_04750 [Proteobacteria bacterium]|nr:hypothetical protein [Pseudomonadota bacterium]
MDPIIIRSFERILDSLIGGVSIYLGYRLFLKLPEKTDSQGKIILPGNISIFLSRVGPGVFFALFGAAVIALSLHNAIQYSVEPKNMEVAQVSQAKINYLGATEGRAHMDSAELEHKRSLLRPSFFWLNQLPKKINSFENKENRVNMQLQLPTVKLELISKVWGPDWCSFEAFEQWVSLGDETALPAECRQAKELFYYGNDQ